MVTNNTTKIANQTKTFAQQFSEGHTLPTVKSGAAPIDTSSHSVVLDHDLHHDPHHKGHHPDLIHNLHITNQLFDLPETFTDTKRVVGDHGSNVPKALIKAPVISHFQHTDDRSEFLHPDFQTTRREAVFHKAASQIFKMGGYVPETTTFIHPVTKQPWSAQKWSHEASTLQHHSEVEHHPDLDKLAIMDTILGNSDRHFGNVLMTRDKKLQLIDNAGSFDYGHVFQAPNPAYAKHLFSSDVSTSALKWLHGITPSHFENMLKANKVPESLVNVAMSRLHESKKWLNHSNGNKQFNRSLGGLLAVIKTHRVANEDDQQLLSKMRNAYYDDMHRGKIVDPAPIGANDKTI